MKLSNNTVSLTRISHYITCVNLAVIEQKIPAGFVTEYAISCDGKHEHRYAIAIIGRVSMGTMTRGVLRSKGLDKLELFVQCSR